jgi:transcriptional regulator with XRE-family HTH domain
MAKGGGDWLSRTLKDLRTAAGLSQVAAAQAAGFGDGPQHPGSAGQVRLLRIERGHIRPTEDDVRRLCEVYRAPRALRAVCLLWVARDTSASAVSSRVILRNASGYQAQLGEVEQASQVIRVWQPLLVPGLLQTEGYARAVFSDRLSGAAVDAAVASRRARAHILDSGKSFTFVISEGALRWNAGRAVMLDQLAHLAASTNHHRLGVIPQSRVVSTFPVHGFGLFDLSPARLVVVGLRHASVLIGDDASVSEYVEWFAKLEGLAVFGDKALDVIAAVARDYRAEGEG